ncbi:D-sedoheptulose 7-phosphate isomerase [Oxyplasma meridianum]|uniref:D-sedoheptulose 7-phosphate isomerase n=1 Tax=Oxyplasma meridianum TaxID=3073602 RepID=A0AAX4NF58_9ARCH
MDKFEIENYLEAGSRTRSSMNTEMIYKVGNEIAQKIMKGGMLILMGNGGSAADAQHIAAELLGRYFKERRSLPAIALTTNTSALTAISNDYSYEFVFERQIEAFASKRDAVIGISTSGSSKNVVRGLAKAKELGSLTIGFTGAKVGEIDRIAHYTIKVPSESTPIIQEVHIAVGHIISQIIEDSISP